MNNRIFEESNLIQVYDPCLGSDSLTVSPIRTTNDWMDENSKVDNKSFHVYHESEREMSTKSFEEISSPAKPDSILSTQTISAKTMKNFEINDLKSRGETTLIEYSNPKSPEWIASQLEESEDSTNGSNDELNFMFTKPTSTTTETIKRGL